MIAIIDYKAGNTCSVINALNRLNADFILTDKSQEIIKADKVILPGVGHARAAMERLNEKKLKDVICGLTQPFLGICVGMQLMAEKSQEGNVDTLAILKGTIEKFSPKNKTIKVPQVGWNRVKTEKFNPLFENIENLSFFYFVHSFYMPINEATIGKTTYDIEYSAAVQYRNFYGVQCHPEKSGKIGEKLIQNFLNL